MPDRIGVGCFGRKNRCNRDPPYSCRRLRYFGEASQRTIIPYAWQKLMQNITMNRNQFFYSLSMHVRACVSKFVCTMRRYPRTRFQLPTRHACMCECAVCEPAARPTEYIIWCMLCACVYILLNCYLFNFEIRFGSPVNFRLRWIKFRSKAMLTLIFSSLSTPELFFSLSCCIYCIGRVIFAKYKYGNVHMPKIIIHIRIAGIFFFRCIHIVVAYCKYSKIFPLRAIILVICMFVDAEWQYGCRLCKCRNKNTYDEEKSIRRSSR